jgi:hypothetical protein
MGYDVHITRRARWFDSEGPDITESEWRALVEDDAEMQLTGFAEDVLPGDEVLRYENPSLAEWLGHPDMEPVWFDFRRNQIIVKDPDEPTLAKMQQLARKLHARVQGDDGEFYDP